MALIHCQLSPLLVEPLKTHVRDSVKPKTILLSLTTTFFSFADAYKRLEMTYNGS